MGASLAGPAAELAMELVYSEELPTRAAAEEREAQLKRWSRAKKEALIGGNRDRLRQLSQSRD